jgi:hypothetical protein
MEFSWHSHNIEDHELIAEMHGIYCWHYRPVVSKLDIQHLFESIATLPSDQRTGFLRTSPTFTRHFVDPFRLQPSEIRIYGKLLPTYAGTVSHILAFGEKNFEHAVQSLEELTLFFELATKFIHVASSPLYIGIAKDRSLRVRIKEHIRDMSNAQNRLCLTPSCFGERAIERNLDRKNLWVSYLPVDPSCSSLLNDVEYILNRSFFPILGAL